MADDESSTRKSARQRPPNWISRSQKALSEHILRLFDYYPEYAAIPLIKIIEEFWRESARDAPRLWRIRNRVADIAWPLSSRIAPPDGLRQKELPCGGLYVTIDDWSHVKVDDNRGVYIRYQSPTDEHAIEHPWEDFEAWFRLFGAQYMAVHQPPRSAASPVPMNSNIVSNVFAPNITVNVPGADVAPTNPPTVTNVPSEKQDQGASSTAAEPAPTPTQAINEQTGADAPISADVPQAPEPMAPLVLQEATNEQIDAMLRRLWERRRNPKRGLARDKEAMKKWKADLAEHGLRSSWRAVRARFAHEDNEYLRRPPEG